MDEKKHAHYFFTCLKVFMLLYHMQFIAFHVSKITNNEGIQGVWKLFQGAVLYRVGFY